MNEDHDPQWLVVLGCFGKVEVQSLSWIVGLGVRQIEFGLYRLGNFRWLNLWAGAAKTTGGSAGLRA